MLTRRTLLAAAVAAPATALITRPAFAAKPAIYAERGIAIDGSDAVAYFTQGGPFEGSSEFELDWMGATWRFVSAENRAMFQENPTAFAPQYGGYCAWAVSKGGTASTAPAAWHIENNKLYLNFNRAVLGLWRRDIPGNIAAGDANWPAVLA